MLPRLWYLNQIWASVLVFCEIIVSAAALAVYYILIGLAPVYYASITSLTAPIISYDARGANTMS